MFNGKPTKGNWIASGELRETGSGSGEYQWVGAIYPDRKNDEPYVGPIATVHSGINGEGIGIAEAEANARLIAAAPDLLAFGQMLIDSLQPDETGEVCTSDVEASVDGLRGAIYKALGENNV